MTKPTQDIRPLLHFEGSYYDALSEPFTAATDPDETRTHTLARLAMATHNRGDVLTQSVGLGLSLEGKGRILVAYTPSWTKSEGVSAVLEAQRDGFMITARGLYLNCPRRPELTIGILNDQTVDEDGVRNLGKLTLLYPWLQKAEPLDVSSIPALVATRQRIAKEAQAFFEEVAR